MEFFLIFGGWGGIENLLDQNTERHTLTPHMVEFFNYVAIAVFKRYTAPRKRYSITPIEISSRL